MMQRIFEAMAGAKDGMNYVQIFGEVGRATQNGILILCGGVSLLIPRLYIKDGHMVRRGDTGIEVSEKWLFENDSAEWIA
ncbi:MAG: hypothetical protein ABI988_05090 [Nitrospirota bacterium]